MEPKSKTTCDEELMKSMFGTHKNNTCKLIDCKFFDLNEATKQSKADLGITKSKMDSVEWMNSLSIEDRVLAISTVFTEKNIEVLDEIRALLDEANTIAYHEEK